MKKITDKEVLELAVNYADKQTSSSDNHKRMIQIDFTQGFRLAKDIYEKHIAELNETIEGLNSCLVAKDKQINLLTK